MTAAILFDTADRIAIGIVLTIVLVSGVLIWLAMRAPDGDEDAVPFDGNDPDTDPGFPVFEGPIVEEPTLRSSPFVDAQPTLAASDESCSQCGAALSRSPTDHCYRCGTVFEAPKGAA